MRFLACLIASSVLLPAQVAPGEISANYVPLAPLFATALLGNFPPDTVIDNPVATTSPFDLRNSAISASTVSSSARVEASYRAVGSGTNFTLIARADTSLAAGQASASTNVLDYIVRFNLPPGLSTELHIASDRTSGVGGSTMVELDLFNDGQFDFVPGLGTVDTTLAIPAGIPQVSVRLRVSASAPFTGLNMLASLSCTLQPQSDCVSDALPICGFPLITVPTFEGNLDVVAVALTDQIFLIIGAQRISAPVPFASPCLLEPSPDIVVPMQPSVPGSSASRITIPEGTPFSGFIQAVGISADSTGMIHARLTRSRTLDCQ